MRLADPRPGRTSRRRAIRIIGAAAGLPALGAALVHGSPEAASFHEWQGEALGAVATLSLWHGDKARARRSLRLALIELQRLEEIFSLYTPKSELRRLNEAGALTRPSLDLRIVLEASQRIGALSRGAFDVSVQPLWELHHRYFDADPAATEGPPRAAVEAARARVDFRQIDVGPRRIGLRLPGMAVTLNGIAQGYITDRITDLLRQEGFDHAMVDMGEIRALGPHPQGRAWRVGLRDGHGSVGAGRTVELADAAVAVSGSYGLTFDATGRHHHLFDPQTGRSASASGDCAVVATTAMVADALATAICVAGADQASTLLDAYPGSRMIFTSATAG